MCGSKNPTVPDVMLQKRKCPRCVVERFRMMQLSQMSCSEHFQKGNCPRCEVQKHPLSQMCASIKTAVPDVMLQNRYCPRCHVLNIPKKPPVPHVVQKIKVRRTRSVNTKITAISTERDLFV
jgi:ribosomal protein S27AE